MGKNKLELSWCKTNYHTKIENCITNDNGLFYLIFRKK